MEVKNLCKPGKVFVKCSHLNFPSFLWPQNCLSLFAGGAIQFALPPNFYCHLPICERKSEEKPPIQSSMQVHKRKGHLKLLYSLTTGKAKVTNVIQHTRSCLSIYWTAICFHFISQPCAWYTAFDKCFHTCDVLFEKPLYITFLIHKKKQFPFQVHANWSIPSKFYSRRVVASGGKWVPVPLPPI